MADGQAPSVLGQTIVNFVRDGVFPEDDEVSKSYVEGAALASALNAVVTARAELEDEIRKISRDSAPEVDTWIKHAHALEEGIQKSKVLAAEIVREGEVGDAFSRTVQEDENHAEFLEKEIGYNTQLTEALEGIKEVKEMLDEAEEAGTASRILDALNILSTAWDLMGKIPAHEITRPLAVLNARSFELKDSIHEDFNNTWDKLVFIDSDKGAVTIDKVADVVTDIPQAILIMKAYKEEQKKIQKFYEDFDDTIIRPRVLFGSDILKSIIVDGNTIRTSEEPASLAIKDLFLDLEKIVHFLADHFPPEFAQSLSAVLMPKLVALIKETWLYSVVPVSLNDMTEFRKTIAIVQVFADMIASLGWEGDGELHDWVENAPRLWVTKRRETSLDITRRQLSCGIGFTKEVERTETQIITETVGPQLTASDEAKEPVKGEHEWDAAWSDDEGKGSDGNPRSSSSVGRSSLEEEQPQWTAEVLREDKAQKDAVVNDDDDGADAWGWGDEDVEDTTGESRDQPTPMAKQTKKAEPEAPRQVHRKVTLTEKYIISSMPGPVFNTITNIVEDGVKLTREENESNPVTAAAVGLFGLPTLVLAMYRAVSPWYYNLAPGGSMYCYNDAMYLAELLQTFSTDFSARSDLGPRAHGKVRLDSEIAALGKFSRRAYGNEMSTQRTVITDLLGGAQSFLHQGSGARDDQVAIESVVAHIRHLSTEWKGILSKSAWAQAVGSLLSTVARKLIRDVEDLSSLGADEAYRVAHLISLVLKLDDLFLPDDKAQPQIPMTSQYAAHWLKLNFLSEVLQSDLKDLQYLWFESDLSLYFEAEEVVELIELSFERSVRTKEAVARIRDEPFPRGVAAEKM